MTVIAVFVDPPRPGLVLPHLVETSPLSEAEAADFYAATVKDTIRAVEASGGELIVNYRSDELIDDEYVPDDADATADVRALAADALGGTDDVRFEVQVGSTESARAGNTITHLLREEDAQSAAVVRGTAPLLVRSVIDNAAMKLRRSPVVLGPTTRGRTYFAAFTEPIDFADALGPLELETLSARADDADVDTDFLPLSPTIADGEGLRTLLSLLQARRYAGRVVPKHTADFISETGLRVVSDDDGERLVLE